MAVSFLCNTGIWSRKILKRGSGGQGDEAVDLQCTRGSRGSLQGPGGQGVGLQAGILHEITLFAIDIHRKGSTTPF